MDDHPSQQEKIDDTNNINEINEDCRSTLSQPHLINVNDAMGKVLWRTTRDTLRTTSVALTVIQAEPGALPFGFCSTFLNNHLQENIGMTK